MIFTVDFDLSVVEIEETPLDENIDEESKEMDSKSRKHLTRKGRKEYYLKAISGEINVWDDYMAKDDDFLNATKKFTPEFYCEYNVGFDYYLDGDWEQARHHFERSNVIY